MPRRVSHAVVCGHIAALSSFFALSGCVEPTVDDGPGDPPAIDCTSQALASVRFHLEGASGARDVDRLDGAAEPGDRVTAIFRIAPTCEGVELSLASYELGPNWTTTSASPDHAVYESHSGRFGPGAHALEVALPDCYFEVDLAFGEVLAHLAPPDQTYDGRLVARAQGGTTSCAACDAPGPTDDFYVRTSDTPEGLAAGAGLRQARCDLGDQVVGILEADCNGDALEVNGNLEWFAAEEGVATLACDQGDDDTYDGGSLAILCLRRSSPLAASVYRRESGGRHGLTLSKPGFDPGVPRVACEPGDTLLGVTEANCDGADEGVTGNLEWFEVDGDRARLGCDQGNDALYDGGFLGITCAQPNDRYAFYEARAGVRISMPKAGAPVVACDPGDRLISVREASCSGDEMGLVGSLEWFRASGTEVKLGCDLGDDELPDGGSIATLCAATRCQSE
jgi:hypothetical protein